MIKYFHELSKDEFADIVKAKEGQNYTWDACAKDYFQTKQPTPTEQMPLIKNPYAEMHGEVFQAFRDGSKQQRASDMAWHNEKVQQVRKEFAEGMPRVQIKPGTKDSILFNSGADEQYEKCQAFIRKEA
jgi:hypothetical protein